MLAMADRRLSKDAAWGVVEAYQDREGKLEALLLQLAELQALPPEQLPLQALQQPVLTYPGLRSFARVGGFY